MKEDKSVLEIGLEARAVNSITRGGIYWLSDLVKLKTSELISRFSGIGSTTKNEIIDKIHKAGFLFSDEEGYMEQEFIIPASFLDTKISKILYLSFNANFFTKKNIITIRDLVNISASEYQNFPSDIKQTIVSSFKILKLEFAFKKKENTSISSLEKEIQEVKTENAEKRKTLQQIERLLLELEALNEEKEELDKKIDSALERLKEMRGRTSGK